jgi:uncharacterized membrane protein
MDLSLLAAEPNPIPLHAYAASLAVIAGAIQFAGPKGTLPHRYLGYLWVGLMLVVSISSFWINTINLFGPFSPIHLLSAFTIWSLFEAIKSARKGQIRRHKRFMQLMYLLALMVTGAFTLLPGRTMNAVLFGL